MKISKRLAVMLAVIALVALWGMAAYSGDGEGNLAPSYNDRFDIGIDARQWKDAHIAGDIYIEGATHDAYETKITVTDPTADRTITFPNASGTVAMTDSTLTGTFTGTLGSGTVGSSQIIDNSVASADITNGTITDTDMGWLKSTLVIASGATSNTTSASAVYNGTLLVQPYANTTNAYIINTSLAADGTATVIVNATLGADFKVQVIRTKP